MKESRLDKSSRIDDIMSRINIGKERVKKDSEEDPRMNKRIKQGVKTELSYEAKMDIYENYSTKTRDYLADKYNISPRNKVSQIAYRLRHNMKEKGHI